LSDDTDPSSPAGDNDPTITNILQVPEITLTKDDNLTYVPQSMVVGEEINYTINVTNTGNVILPLITITDDNAVIVSGSPIQNLAPNGTVQVTAKHIITQADLDAGHVLNTAVGTADFNGSSYTDMSDDPDPDVTSNGDNDPTETLLEQNPVLMITKDDGLSSLPQNLAVGDVITYTITVYNQGNVTLDNITVNDNVATIQGNNVIATLAPGDSQTLTAEHIVTQDDINNGFVSNSADGYCNFLGQIVSDISDDIDVNSPAGDDDPTITNIAQVPQLTVYKDDNYDYTAQDLNAGDIITYQITVINTGNVTLNNITVTDDNATIVSGGNIPILHPGEQATAVANHTVTQADLDLGFVSNQAVASTVFDGNNITDLSDDTDTASPSGTNDPTITYLVQNPALVVKKDDQMDYGEQNLAVGDVITYLIMVTNTGNVTLNNIVLSDANANIQGSNVIPTLLPGETATVQATHTVNQNELNAGIIYNSAQGQVIYNTMTITDMSDDTDLLSPSGDDDPTITHLHRYTGIELTKDDQLPYTAQNLQVGDVITYNIFVTNTGNVTLSLATVSDNNANIVSGNPVVDLMPGATATVIAQHIVTQADIDAGQVINSASVDTSFNGVNFGDISDDTDPDSPSGVDDPTVTTIVQSPSYIITKDDGLPYNDQNLQVGDVINYVINVTNTGNVTIHNINITDNNASINGSQIITDLNVNQTVSLYATHTVTQADIDSGLISNSATGTALFNGADLTDVSDDEDVNSPPNDDDPTLTHIFRNPELTVTKDDNLPYNAQLLGVGDVIVYTITVTNSGNVTLTDIDVTDANASITSGTPIAQLDPGQTVTLQATHTITQADVDAGMVSNSATATTTFEGVGVSDISDDTDIASPGGPDDPTITHLMQLPELTVTKDDQLAFTPQDLQVGDVITYVITVQNTGNVTLQNIVVTDANATITGNSLITTLAPGDFVTINAEHVVTQADIDNGQIINSALASVQYNGTDISDFSSTRLRLTVTTTRQSPTFTKYRISKSPKTTNCLIPNNSCKWAM